MRVAGEGECPNCGLGDTTFTMSSHVGSGVFVRRRKCTRCGYIFQTVESMVSDKRAKILLGKAEKMEQSLAYRERKLDNKMRASVKEPKAAPERITNVIWGVKLPDEINEWMHKAIKDVGMKEFMQSIITDAYYEENGDD